MSRFTKTPRLHALLSILLAFAFTFGGAQISLSFVVPAEAASSSVENYYAGLDESKTGEAFRAELADLITETHTKYTSYDGLANAFKQADADPDKPGNIIWFYTGSSVPFSGFGSAGGTTNREHVWPKNAGDAFPEKAGPGSDAHHLRPTEANLNSSRGSKSFAEVTNGSIVKQNGSTNYPSLCYTDGTFFYPGEGFRGATARILMYLQVRWGDQYDLYFVDGAGSNKSIGKISDLMKWHLEEPPTEAEIRRNEVVYGLQGNRNPFIDHPEYAEKIFCNDGKSYNTALKNVVATYGGYDQQVPPTSLAISPTSLNLAEGQTAHLTITATPSTATKTVDWSSSNTNVASVKDGTVTAHKNGTATIYATSALDSSVKAQIVVSVKGIAGFTLSGTPTKTTYMEGNTFSPDGLTVRVTYTDGTTGTVPTESCLWLDGTTAQPTLSGGTTSVICQLGTFTQSVTGITVSEATEASVTITRDDFTSTGGYAWHTWQDGELTGKAYAYMGNTTHIQMNSSKTSQYIFLTSAAPGGIVSVTVKISEGSKKFDLRTSTTPFSEGSGVPSAGTSQGEQMVTAGGTTWILNTTDTYFTLNYKDSNAVYISEIIITYGTSSGGSDTPADEHNFGAWVNEVPATCKADGQKGHYTCSHCTLYFDKDHNVLDSIVIAQTGHQYSTWVAEKPATCKENGIVGHYTCNTCDLYFDSHYEVLHSITVEKTTHSFGDWSVTTPPTGTEAGEECRVCGICGAVETRPVSPVGTAGDFVLLVNGLSVESADEQTFQTLKDAFMLYQSLADEEKATSEVQKAYSDLLALAEDYNGLVSSHNQTHCDVTEVAVHVFSASMMALAALLWLLKRQMI